jgi:hypothetical protein
MLGVTLGVRGATDLDALDVVETHCGQSDRRQFQPLTAELLTPDTCRRRWQAASDGASDTPLRIDAAIPDLRLFQLTVRNLEIEFREVTTVEMPYQVSRAEIECFPDLLHFLPRVDLSAENSIGLVSDDYAIFPSTVPGLHSK